MTYRDTMKDLFVKHNAMMAGQWTDGDYLEEFQRICDFYCLDSLTEWEILEDRYTSGTGNFTAEPTITNI